MNYGACDINVKKDPTMHEGIKSRPYFCHSKILKWPVPNFDLDEKDDTQKMGHYFEKLMGFIIIFVVE
jgi:hypothetical protein